MAETTRVVLLLLAAAGAVATVFTHLAQQIGLPFRVYAWSLAVAVLVAITAIVRSELPRTPSSLRGRREPLMLGILAGATALLTSLCRRPELDDLHYVPNVVYYLAHPEVPMSHAVHYVYAGALSIHSFYAATAMPFDYSQGAFAYLLGVDYLSIHHVASSLLLGFLVPLVWYYVLSRFDFDDRAAVAGAALICLCLTLMGERHQTFGNYAFSRLWNGKAVLMTLGLPLFAALTLDFFRHPGWRPWLLLFLTATALVGTSTTAIVQVTLLAAALTPAALLALAVGPRAALTRTLTYGASLLYVAGFGLAFLFGASEGLGSSGGIGLGWKRDFLGQAQHVFAAPFSGTAILAVTSGVGALGLLRGWQRRFFGIWLAFILLAYLNPIVAPWLMEYVAPRSIYWRLFYLLPFPLAIGVVGAALAARYEVGTSRRGSLLAAAVVAVLVGAHLVPGVASTFRGSMDVGLGYKIDPGRRRTAEQVIEASLEGPMLAPWPLAGDVTMLDGSRPQLLTSRRALGLWFPEEAMLRLDAHEFLSGKRSEGLTAVVALVQRYPEIRSVVTLRRPSRGDRLRRVLKKAGFVELRVLDRVAIFSRPRE